MKIIIEFAKLPSGESNIKTTFNPDYKLLDCLTALQMAKNNLLYAHSDYASGKDIKEFNPEITIGEIYNQK